MIANLESVDDLRALARAKVRSTLSISVPVARVDVSVNDGWELVKKGKTTARMRKDKQGVERLRDRVWSLLYRLGVPYMSGDGSSAAPEDMSASVDLGAVDDEIFLAINCVSLPSFKQSALVREAIDALTSSRDALSRQVAKAYPVEFKRNNVLCVFVENVQLTDDDQTFADSNNVVLFDEHDLEYYEKLADHLGSAAKYQMFADLLPGKTIPGLTIRVPAVRTRMGPQSCLTFPISPEYLLKIAYVSHRSKGKASDVHTYQRMLKKGRLKKIREYISDRGVFPTNIVVNIDKRYIKFERVHQATDRDSSDASGVLGWLTIRPAYKSAWVIDGQHRLFAYSGHEYAKTGHLSVLAFEGIAPSAQAKLFVDINAKQKSVKPSLLQELFAELHWDAESPTIRVQAIISKAVQSLDLEMDSPFIGRIQTADAAKDSKRCISLASVFRALERHSLFIEREQHNEVVEAGPLWAGSSEKTLARTIGVLKKWFNAIAEGTPDWWLLGSAPGGGLAMNDSVVACIAVMASVLEHLKVEKPAISLSRLDLPKLWELLEPYARALGDHFGRFSADDRQRYRDLRGSQGQTARTRRAQQALRSSFPRFGPPGLEDFLQREKEQTNLKGKEIIDRLEILIQRLVVTELKQEFGADDAGWWQQGIPRATRTAVVTRAEQDDNKRIVKEAYLDLIEYRGIVTGQWSLFQGLMGIGKKTDSKDKQTKWLVDLNEMRRVVSHASSGVTLSVEQLNELEVMESTLTDRMKSLPGQDDRSDDVDHAD